MPRPAGFAAGKKSILPQRKTPVITKWVGRKRLYLKVIESNLQTNALAKRVSKNEELRYVENKLLFAQVWWGISSGEITFS